MGSSDATHKKTVRARTAGWAIALFGVLLPLATWLVELVTHMCEESFADPMPTPLHVLLVALVPSGIALVACQMRAQRVVWWGVAGLGLALGISSYYALLFLPLAPLALMMVLWMGLGLLPLAPLLSFVSALVLLRRLRALGIKLRPVALGAAAAWALLLGAEVPTIVNSVGMNWATSAEPAQRARGLALLRTWGDTEQLLRACYAWRVDSPGVLSLFVRERGHGLSPEDARALYFRVTGEPFNSVPRPAMRSFRGGFDDGVAGEQVAGKVDALELSGSRLDGWVAGESALGYLEWTLTFENNSLEQQEARALVALPSGGVVSRATLWVNGEPKEATFAAKGTARAAYQAVVARRRDPLLVTLSSPERVLVQCFPVPPNSKMQIRIGMTFPLVPDESGHARTALPYLVERNFDVPAHTKHALWVASKTPVMSPQPLLQALPQGHGLRGALTDEALQATMLSSPFAPAVHYSELHPKPAETTAQLTQTQPPAGSAMLPLPIQPERVIQRFVREPIAEVQRWVVALDTSATLEPHREAIAKWLAKLGERVPLSLVLASDAEPQVMELARGASVERLRAALADTNFEGGRDSVAAALTAVELAVRSGVRDVVWISAPQPADLGSSQALQQVLTRAEPAVSLVPFTFGGGEHALLADLPSGAVRRAIRHGSTLDDLAGFVRDHTGTGTRWQVQRARSSEPLDPAAQRADAHLTRLWASEHVESQCKGQPHESCTALAMEHQLITSLTGAVVLETAQQYAEAGLTPAGGTDVPSVPEPATWLLTIVLLMAFLAHTVHQRRART